MGQILALGVSGLWAEGWHLWCPGGSGPKARAAPLAPAGATAMATPRCRRGAAAMLDLPPRPSDPGSPAEVAGAGSNKAPMVELTAEQLYALCLAVACSVENDHPGRELGAVRSVLESVEVRLLSALADPQLARWHAACSQATATGTGVA
jgi:hypothetical protein